MPEMHVSPAGRALIEKWEGCRLDAYQDVVGVWTIGYGCTGPEAAPGRVITKEEADVMLSDRLANEFEPGVSAAIGDAPVTQAQFDAMVSLAFNIGVGAFRGSTVARQHKAGNYISAADAFSMWNKAGGRVLEPLTRRRLDEEKMYLSTRPATPQAPVLTPPTYTRIDAARAMQTALKNLGLYTDKVDGLWGELSRAAYDAFNQGAST